MPQTTNHKQNMRRLLYIIALLAVFGLKATAQHPKFNKEEFRARQEAFITAKASLTTQEAKQFFPLYFELQDKKESINHQAWEQIRKANKDDLTENEYATIVEGTIQARIATDKLDLEYLKKYKKFLPAKKIFEIQRAETCFHRELIKPQRPPQRSQDKAPFNKKQSK